jgi:hypothetical protein
MEGLRYAAEARQAMQLVRIGRLPFDRQSKERNHLVLSVSAGVSGSHAEVRFAQGRIFLRDLGSSNGTFAAQQAVTTETELKSGEIFLVSLTPVQVYLTRPLAAPPPFEPLPVTHWEDVALEPLLKTATECAAGRREGYVDTRHLLDAILRVEDVEVDDVLMQGGLSRRSAREELFRKGLYRDDLSWLAEILVKPVNLTGTFETAVVSPRVARLLDAARPGLPATGDGTRLAARRLLAGLVADRFGPVGDWLTAHGMTSLPDGFASAAPEGEPAAPVDETGQGRARGPARPTAGPARQTTLLSEAIGDATAASGPAPFTRTPLPPPPPQPPPSSPADSAVAPSPMRRKEPAREPEPAPAPVREASRIAAAPVPVAEAEPVAAPPAIAWGTPRTPAEILLDGRARELADELFVLAGELRFGSPDDRRRQLKRRVEKELAPLPTESRTRFLELLRRYFPVLPAGAGVDPEVPRLRRKLEELEKKRLEEAPSKSVARGKAQQAGPGTPLPLRQLVHGEDLGQADRNVLVLRKVIEYALAMEGMTLGLIQSLTMPGNETMAFKLPGFKETMRSFLHGIEQGKPVSVQRVEEYLDELKKWQVAMLAAFHSAPGEWFDRLWKKINPVTLESAPRSAGWKLRGEAAEWWDLYKIAVRDLSPDLVNDQILQGVARLSKEELEKLRKTQRGEHS